MLNSRRLQCPGQFQRLRQERVLCTYRDIARREFRTGIERANPIVLAQRLVLVFGEIELRVRSSPTQRCHGLVIVEDAVEQYSSTDLGPAFLRASRQTRGRKIAPRRVSAYG